MKARLLGALALLVLTGCGVAAGLSAGPPANLLGRSGWVLATTLPSGADVDPDWGYTLNAPLAPATAPATGARGAGVQPAALRSPS